MAPVFQLCAQLDKAQPTSRAHARRISRRESSGLPKTESEGLVNEVAIQRRAVLDSYDEAFDCSVAIGTQS
jgi:hypothetical protein